MNKSRKKLEELILYISSKCAGDSRYGRTKLSKILFYSDFLFFYKHLKPITGTDYIHVPQGPMPDNFRSILESMEGSDIAEAVFQVGGYTQKKIVPLREPDLSLFEPEMIAHVDSVIEKVAGETSLTATQLSDLSHKTMGWRVTEDGEKIPYETVFLKDLKYQTATEWEQEHAKKVAVKLADQYGYPS